MKDQWTAVENLPMTLPRPVPTDRTWFITRRCSQQLFLLLPQPFVKETFEYCLARASNDNGIHLHAWMVMSDHYHLVLTDPLGRLPAFEQQLNSLIARILNKHWGRRGGFWEIGSYNRVEPLTEAAVVDKIVYTLANPVSAGVVARAWRWEGASSVGLAFGQSRRVPRPAFLRDGEPIETLRLVAPPSSTSSPPELNAEVRDLLHSRELAVEHDFAKQGRRYQGMPIASTLPWTTTPTSKEAPRTIRPRFATRDRKIMNEAIAAWKTWLAHYQRAWADFRAGARETVFPAGTYMLRVRYGVSVSVS